MRFQNRVCLITGGAQGIGRGIAEAFHTEGAKVAFMDLDREAGLALQVKLPGSWFSHGDAADEADLERFVSGGIQRFGAVHYLINNACVGAGGILSDCDSKAFDRCIDIGLRAPYLLSRLCLPHFEAGMSCIINIASTRGFMSEPDSEAYTAAKGGILALTRALAVSLGPEVRVNSISPGWIETGLHRKSTDLRDIHHKESDKLQHPAGRVGVPQDIAAACLYLCSDEATFITGQNLTVDGGMSTRMVYSGDWGWEYHPE